MKNLENDLKHTSNNELDFLEGDFDTHSYLLKTYIKHLKETEKVDTEYFLSLKELMFIVSHKIRHSLSNIMGLLDIYDYSKSSQEESEKIIALIKESAGYLDIYTEEITNFIHNQKMKVQDRKKSSSK